MQLLPLIYPSLVCHSTSSLRILPSFASLTPLCQTNKKLALVASTGLQGGTNGTFLRHNRPHRYWPRGFHNNTSRNAICCPAKMIWVISYCSLHSQGEWPMQVNLKWQLHSSSYLFHSPLRLRNWFPPSFSGRPWNKSTSTDRELKAAAEFQSRKREKYNRYLDSFRHLVGRVSQRASHFSASLSLLICFTQALRGCHYAPGNEYITCFWQRLYQW